MERTILIYELIRSTLLTYSSPIKLFHSNDYNQYFQQAKKILPQIILIDNYDASRNYAVIKSIKQDPCLNQVPLILMYAFKDQINQDLIRELKIDFLLQKPFQTQILHNYINKSIQKLKLQTNIHQRIKDDKESQYKIDNYFKTLENFSKNQEKQSQLNSHQEQLKIDSQNNIDKLLQDLPADLFMLNDLNINKIKQ